MITSSMFMFRKRGLEPGAVRGYEKKHKLLNTTRPSTSETFSITYLRYAGSEVVSTSVSSTTQAACKEQGNDVSFPSKQLMKNSTMKANELSKGVIYLLKNPFRSL